MKKLLTILFLFVSFFAISQNNGINFQGVGRNSTGAVLASQKISLRFSVIQGSETGAVEYVESKEVTTNAQGIFSVVIGDGTQISKTGNFTDINWKINPKFLKVEMDPAGGSNFAAMGTTRLQSVPFAYYANGVNADNVDGVLSALKGGTGVASITALKTALGVDQVNNTSDLAKPISTATQAALDTKVSTATFSTTVATKANVADLALKAPLESPTFTGTVAGITKAMVELGSVDNTSDLSKPISTATQEALDTKVSTATFSTTMATKANVADVALKAPLESPTFTGTVSGITKAMVGLSNVANTADLAKPISTATQEALDTKVSVATFSTTMVTKENAANKSAAIDLGAGATSDILFPTQKAVKTYVDTQVNAGGVADGGITTIKLADLAVTDEKVATGIDKAKVGLANVDNTADVDKPISTATQEALDEKLSTMIFDDRLRNIAKLDESNYFTSEQNIFSGNQIVIGELTLPNGILNLSAGTQILSGIDSPTTIQNSANKDFTIRTNETFEDEDENVVTREHELKFTADGKLRFSDGSRIYPYLSDQDFESDELRNIFSIRSKTGGYIELKTTSEEEDYYWTFKDDGKITFPDRGTTMGVTNGPGFSIFELNSPNAISLFVRDPYHENSTYGGINILQRIDQPFAIELITPAAESNNLNVWIYDSEGRLTFPGGTTLGKNVINEDFSPFEINSSDGIALQSFRTFEGEINLNAAIGIFPEGNQGNILMMTKDLESDGQENIWQFDSQGVISFPDGSVMGKFELEEDISTFTILSNSGIFLSSGELSENVNKVASVRISGDENRGKVLVATKSNEDNLINNHWTYDSRGKLTFPDLTIASGNISDTGNFGFDTSPTNNGFSIITAGTTNGTTQLWKLDKDGSLTFPDLTIASGNISNTGNFGFDTSPTNNGFSIITAGTTSGTTQLWKLDKDGSLTFPDLTVAVGNLSNTGNFGFDTRSTNSGFSIITGNSSGTSQLWSFETNGGLTFPDGTYLGDVNDGAFGFDTRTSEYGFTIRTGDENNPKLFNFDSNGVLNLPGSAKIGMEATTGFYFPEALQITTPNAFILKTSTSGSNWVFEANGNTVFPADLGVVGLIAGTVNAGTISVLENGSFKIGDENLLDKFKSDIFNLTGNSLSFFNNNPTTIFYLSAIPRPNSPFTMYLNGKRIKKESYTVNSTTVTFTKSQTETEVEVQFDYIKN